MDNDRRDIRGRRGKSEDTKGRRELLQRSGITFTARNLGGQAREFHIRMPRSYRVDDLT